MLCERCKKDTTLWTTSKFNPQTVCMECKKEELEHFFYPLANAQETLRVMNGNMNYYGIGLPQDLATKYGVEQATTENGESTVFSYSRMIGYLDMLMNLNEDSKMYAFPHVELFSHKKAKFNNCTQEQLAEEEWKFFTKKKGYTYNIMLELSKKFNNQCVQDKLDGTDLAFDVTI